MTPKEMFEACKRAQESQEAASARIVLSCIKRGEPASDHVKLSSILKDSPIGNFIEASPCGSGVIVWASYDAQDVIDWVVKHFIEDDEQ